MRRLRRRRPPEPVPGIRLRISTVNGVLTDVDSLQLYHAARYATVSADKPGGDWLDLVAGQAGGPGQGAGVLGGGQVGGQAIPAGVFSTVPLRIEIRAELLEAAPDA